MAATISPSTYIERCYVIGGPSRICGHVEKIAGTGFRMGESMAEQLKEKLEEKGMECCHCHQKATPRSEKEKKQLQNRLSRMAGQLNGISRMLEENRYCGDILTQVAAVESALQAFGYAILKEHMETCVVEEIRKGNTAIVEEAVDLVKKLK